MREQTADAQLVRLSVSGDRGAFEEIVRRNVSPVSAVAYALTGDRALSEDVTQEVFLTAWRRLKDLRDPEKLRSWLCVIAQNVANTFGRKMARDPLRAAGDLEPARNIAASAPSPAETAIMAEQQRLVWSAIERIPEKYRVPMVLFYQEGRSISEVGCALDLSDGAVRQRLSRARSLLKDEVAAMVETNITGSRPGALLVTAIMTGIAGSTLQAGAATAAAAAATKLAGGSVTGSTVFSGALLGAILGPLQIAGGVFRALVKYRTGQTPEERRLILRFLIQVPCAIFVFALFHISLIRASARGLLTDSQCYMAMGLEVSALLSGLAFLHRRNRKQHYALLKAGERNLNEVQARRLRLMEASPREREVGTYLDAVDRFRTHPYSAAYAAHGGLMFAGTAWIVIDGACRNDTPLLVGSLLAPFCVELLAVARTVRRPARYLLHRSIMFLSMIPLIGCAVAWWTFQGVSNVLLTSPPDNWFAMRLLPALVCVGYFVPAVYSLAKHRRLTRET